MSSPHSILSDTFGFPQFRPGQEEIIEALLAGENCLAVMPTGAGKSLCYQVPAMLFDRVTIVVSPLVALMDDQVAGLRGNGVPVAAIHSGQSREDNVSDWRRVASGQAKLLYLSPERLMTPRMQAALAKLDPAMFVVDEAHCVSKWGPAFRPEYAQLEGLKTAFPKAVIAAFTATADAQTREDIAQKLFSGKGKTIKHGFDRPNLELAVTPKNNAKAQLLAFLENVKDQSGIVYCLSRKNTEQTAEFLNSKGFRALPYHAGMTSQDRFENQERFMAEDGVIIVATIAFGMGIDKPDIRFVFHMNMPGSLEAYYQEIGRAGRDGAPAVTAMLFGMGDVVLRRKFILDDGAEQDHQMRELKRLDALVGYCEASACRRQALLSYFGDTSEPCGNCDNCFNPPKMVDVTSAAQAVFSALKETGQRFGPAHVIDVAHGKLSEKVESRGHNTLSSFGAASNFAVTYLRGLMRQAIAGGFVMQDVSQYGTLSLTPKGLDVLAGKIPMTCREITAGRKSRTGSKSPKIKSAAQDLSARDADLFAALKALRFSIAREIGKPAYVVFSDATLIDMSRRRPGTLDEMLGVSGMGSVKLARYGEQFLEVVLQD